MKFFVASKNPVKINAVLLATQKQFPNALVKGFEVTSGVSVQPMSDEETKLGAFNRAYRVRTLAKSQQLVSDNEEALFIGLEGGVFQPAFANHSSELWSTVWAVVMDQDGNSYYSNGARFPLPDFMSDLLLAGEEMGPALGRRLKDPDVRKKEGMIGFLTNHFTNRSDEYASVVKIAIGLWYGQDSLLTK